MFKDVDLYDFGLFIILLILTIFGGLGLYRLMAHGTEKSCVNYYLENNYILEECDIYKDKLESLGE